MKKITIYTSETCPYCKKVKEELDGNGGFTVENKLTSKFKDEYVELSSLVGIGTVPLIVYEGNYLVAGRDFNSPKQLVYILDNMIKPKHSFEERTYQRLVTLNYNISTAFEKLDALLQKENDEHEH